jgi:putative transposase
MIEDLPVSLMCKIAKVSKSGYYKWLKNIDKVKDEKDALLIAEVFFKSRKKAGFRTVKMKLLADYEVAMNHKKIIRIMRKYNLITKIRRINPYKRIARINQANTICENVLNRKFKTKKPNQAYSTDITYLKYSGNTAFLSTLLDVKTSEVISYSLSNSLQMNFVLKMMEDGIKKTPSKHLDGLIIHSDRGAHYTSIDYQARLKKSNIVQSMSNVASPLDNAPIESFFGHLKDEVDYKQCKSFEEVSEKIDSYMYDYNHNRKQWSKNKMTPIEYKNFLLAS